MASINKASIWITLVSTSTSIFQASKKVAENDSDYITAKGSDEKVDCFNVFLTGLSLYFFFGTLTSHRLRTRALYTVAGAHCWLSIGKFCHWKPYGFNV